ncbi:MAG TPA: LytTR family DNA-binding domain-containing protein [Cyclobacteriaceae bacterium]
MTSETDRIIRSVLVDDEKHCLETLAWQLEKFCPQVSILAICESGEQALEVLSQRNVDLVFLDIEMPRLNGFELLQRLGNVNFDVIFTTAYDMFAVKAFKFSALDYLLKPIDKDELVQAVAKVRSKTQAIRPEQLDILFQTLYGKKPGSPKVALPTMSGLEFVTANDIIHCQSEGNYTHIYLEDKSHYLICRTLKETEELLSAHNFFRVHHSHIINLNHIRKYVKGDGGYVIMSDNTSVNVSRSRKEELLRLFV